MDNRWPPHQAQAQFVQQRVIYSVNQYPGQIPVMQQPQVVPAQQQPQTWPQQQYQMTVMPSGQQTPGPGVFVPDQQHLQHQQIMPPFNLPQQQQQPPMMSHPAAASFSQPMTLSYVQQQQQQQPMLPQQQFIQGVTPVQQQIPVPYSQQPLPVVSQQMPVLQQQIQPQPTNVITSMPSIESVPQPSNVITSIPSVAVPQPSNVITSVPQPSSVIPSIPSVPPSPAKTMQLPQQMVQPPQAVPSVPTQNPMQQIQAAPQSSSVNTSVPSLPSAGKEMLVSQQMVPACQHVLSDAQSSGMTSSLLHSDSASLSKTTEALCKTGVSKASVVGMQPKTASDSQGETSTPLIKIECTSDDNDDDAQDAFTGNLFVNDATGEVEAVTVEHKPKRRKKKATSVKTTSLATATSLKSTQSTSHASSETLRFGDLDVTSEEAAAVKQFLEKFRKPDTSESER